MTQIMFTVSALYHFTRFDDPGALRAPMVSLCEHEGIKGTILLAKEGINGTVAGPNRELPGFGRISPRCLAVRTLNIKRARPASCPSNA